MSRKRVQRLMGKMGLRAIYRRPKTSLPELANQRCPYLLSKTEITSPNQVWAADLAYIPMARGFSTWWPSWTGTAGTQWPGGCPTRWRRASAPTPCPRLWDEESRSVQHRLGEPVLRLGVHPGASGPEGEDQPGRQGEVQDNIMVERLWRTVKYEEVYLKAYAGADEARRELGDYLRFYNNPRLHQALGYRTPAEVYHHPEAPEEALSLTVSKTPNRYHSRVPTPL